MTAVLEGEKELLKALKDLPDNIFKRVLRNASRKAMQIVLMKARQKVPINTLALTKSLAVKAKVYAKSASVVTMIGARSIRGEDGGNPAMYAHLVEGGHVVRNRKGGPVIGHADPHPFLAPALEEGQQAVVSSLRSELRRGVEREAAKVGKKR